MTRRFEYLSSLEAPHIHNDEKIVLMRTVANLPDVYTVDEWTEIRKNHYIHLYSFAPQKGDSDEYTGRKDLFMGIGYEI